MEKIDLIILGEKFIGFCDVNGPHILPDPFCQSKLLEVSRIGPGSKYIPLILAKAKCGQNYFLFFVSNFTEHVIQWSMTEKLVFKSQESLSFDEFTCFLSIYNFQLSCWYSEKINTNFDVIGEKIETKKAALSLKLPAEVGDEFKCIDDLKGRWSDLKLFEKNYKSNYFDLCAEVESLIEKDLCSPEIFKFFKRFVTEGFAEKFIFADDRGTVIVKPGTHVFIAALINSWKFVCLREIFYLLNGKYLCYSPFSNRWLTSEKTICSVSGMRFSLFRDGAIEFLEFSGRGYIAPVNGYLIPVLNNEVIIIDPRSSPASWFGVETYDKGVINAAINAVRSAPSDSFEDEKFILNNNLDNNLGHFFWNDLSGIFYTHKICKELSLAIPAIAIFKKNLISQKAFSSLSYSQMTSDMVQEFAAAPLCLFDGDRDDEFIKDGSIVFLKSIFMSGELIEFYHNFLINAEPRGHVIPNADKKFRIFINVRSHNKSLLNLRACFSALLASIGNAEFNKIEFLLEGDSSAETLIRELRDVSMASGFGCQILLKLNAYELYPVLHDVDYVIAPVGSGLILPTWMLNKPCITYAEPQHLSQLAWWELVVDRKLQIDSFTNREISPATQQMYASYTIDPVIFGEKTVASIRKYYR